MNRHTVFIIQGKKNQYIYKRPLFSFFNFRQEYVKLQNLVITLPATLIPCSDPHLNFLKIRNTTRNRDPTRLIKPVNPLRLLQQFSEQWVIKIDHRNYNPPRVAV